MFWMTIPWFCAAAAAAAGICYLVRGLLGERVSLSPKYNKNAPPPKGLALPLLALSAVFAGLAVAAGYIGYTTNDIVGTSTVDPAVHGGATGAACVAIGLLTWAIIGDRAKGRRRCPKCWHDLAEIERLHNQGRIPALTCPECGHNLKAPKALARTRRPKWAVLTAAVILTLSTLFAVGGPATNRHGWRGAIPLPILVYTWPWLPEEWVLYSHTGSLAERLDDPRPQWLDAIYADHLAASVDRTLKTTANLERGVKASDLANAMWRLPYEEVDTPITVSPPLLERFVHTYLKNPNSPDITDLLTVVDASAYLDFVRQRPTAIVELSEEDAVAYVNQLLSPTNGLGSHAWGAMYIAAWDHPAAVDTYLKNLSAANNGREHQQTLYTLANTAASTPEGRAHLQQATKSDDPNTRLNATLVLLIEADNRYFQSTNYESIGQSEEVTRLMAQLMEYLRAPSDPSAFQSQLANAIAIVHQIVWSNHEHPPGLADAIIPWIVATDGRDEELFDPLLWDVRQDYFQPSLTALLKAVPHMDAGGLQRLETALEQALLQDGINLWRDTFQQHAEAIQTVINQSTDQPTRDILRKPLQPEDTNPTDPPPQP